MARMRIQPARPGNPLAAVSWLALAVVSASMIGRLGVGWVLALPIALGLVCMAYRAGRPRDWVEVQHGQVDGERLWLDESVVLYCDSEVCCVKVHTGRVQFFAGTPADLTRARKVAADVASHVGARVVECIADTEEEACRTETLHVRDWYAAVSRKNCPDWDDITPRPPTMVSFSMERVRFATEDGVLVLDRHGLRSHVGRFALGRMLHVSLMVYGRASGVRSQWIGITIYTLKGWNTVAYQRIPIHLQSSKRKQMLDEAAWMVEQIDSARVRFKRASMQDARAREALQNLRAGGRVS